MVRVRRQPVLRVPLVDQPRIRTAARAPLDDRGFAVRYLADHHALHLYDYAGVVRLGGRSCALRPGDVTLTPAGVEARYDLPRPGSHLVVHFWSGDVTRGSRDAMALPWHQSLGDERGEAEARVHRVMQLHARSGASRLAGVAAATALQGLLHWLALREEPDPGAGQRAATRAVDAAAALLDRRLRHRLSVPDLARQVGMSQNYLARRFRERYGLTMQQYLAARRIAVARELLAGTDLPIHAIGQRVGLPDPQHFNKQFRQHTGMSPTRARRSRPG